MSGYIDKALERARASRTPIRLVVDNSSAPTLPDYLPCIVTLCTPAEALRKHSFDYFLRAKELRAQRDSDFLELLETANDEILRDTMREHLERAAQIENELLQRAIGGA